MLRITKYSESLLDGLDDLDWPEGIKELQRNWIGRSEGAEMTFDLPSINESLTVFTTRPDTLFGATYMVIAPEHPLVQYLTITEKKKEVNNTKDTIMQQCQTIHSSLAMARADFAGFDSGPVIPCPGRL